MEEGLGEKEYELPPYLPTPIVITDEMLTRERSTARSFLRAVLKGHFFFRQKPDEAIALMQKVLRVEDKATTKRLYQDEMRRYNPSGRLAEQFLIRVIEKAREDRGVRSVIDIKEVFDLSIAKEVEEELRKEKWTP